jgi:heme O synthase-like polyprenyltransferase
MNKESNINRNSKLLLLSSVLLLLSALVPLPQSGLTSIIFNVILLLGGLTMIILAIFYFARVNK